MFKGGNSPDMSVDRIGGDRAATGANTPRSTRVSSGSDGSVGSVGFVVGGGCGGVRGSESDGIGQPLTPLDLGVGQKVLLMKRSMTVCGWDETAHVWWENMTGRWDRQESRGQRGTGGGRGGRGRYYLCFPGCVRISCTHTRRSRD